MGQILLVRHGQASWGADDYDVLSELGHEQARLLGTSLHGVAPDLVVHGGMRRHRETFEGCAETAGWSMTAKVDEGWQEYDHVAMLKLVPAPDGAERDKALFQQWIESGTDRWTSGGDGYDESFAEFGARVEAAFAALPDQGSVVVFTSGGPIAWIAATLLSDEPATRVALWRRLNVVLANGGLTRIVAGRRGRTLVGLNETGAVQSALSYR